MSASQKRDDLQVIRGFAIVVVLLFHFFPAQFPNGYVGVDQFFVLSGFLMMLIFGSKEINLQSSKGFYIKRIKRIVPLYLCIVLLGLTSIFVVFPEQFVTVNTESGLSAITFTSNMAFKSIDSNYFLQLQTAFDLFTHTWSLSVEMQFYLVAPIIFYIGQMLSGRPKLLFHLLLWGLSLAYQLTSDATTAFNSMWCRLWQFETGILSFIADSDYIQKFDYSLLTSDEAESQKSKLLNDEEQKLSVELRHEAFSRFLLGAAIAITAVLSLFPFELPQQIIRVLCTICTGAVISLSPSIQWKFLSNRVFVYIGDVSYSLYLVHWPIYCFVKFYFHDNAIAFAEGLLASVIFAVIIYETFEKWYLRQTSYCIGIFIAFLYVTIVGVLISKEQLQSAVDQWSGNTDEVIEYKTSFPTNLTVEEKIKYQYLFNREHDFAPDDCLPVATFGTCTFQSSDLGTKANLSILVLGNSYSTNVAHVINKYFAKYAGRFEKIAYYACGILLKYTGYGCGPKFDEAVGKVAEWKPDVLFIVCRWVEAYYDTLNDTATDPAILTIKAQIKKYEPLVTKKIFILDAYHTVHTQGMGLYPKFLREGQDPNDHAEEMLYLPHYRDAFRRGQEIAKDCPKCVVYSYMEAFTSKNGSILVADEVTGLPIFTTSSHLTPVGIELIDPIYAKLERDYDFTKL